jgi:multidrug efflux pump subunit AcrA (membrane-fusion protein)
MMSRNSKILKTMTVWCCLLLVVTGCAGSTQISGDVKTQKAGEREVTLLEPEGAAGNYEAVTYRNLYKAEIYPATVDFDTKEYAYSTNQTFAFYGTLPGETVQSGSPLIYGDTGDLEKQIEEKQESIEDQEQDHGEAVEIMKEKLEKPLEDQAFYKRLCEEYQNQDDRQAEFADYGVKYQDVTVEVNRLQEQLKQQNELYELDHDYALSELERLQDKKEKTILKATAAGTVVAIAFLSYGDFVSSRSAAAVGDLNSRKLHCDFISKADVNSARDIYAFFDGKRYEITYEPMKAEEYNKRIRNQDSLYATFSFQDAAQEIAIGDYGVVIRVSDKAEHVLSVTTDAIHKDAGGNFVYRMDGETSIYTPVTIGMSDGIYTEIVSGLSEGDRVFAPGTVKADKETMTLEKGSLTTDFEAPGYLYFPSYEVVKNPVEYGTCYFVESLVHNNQQVKKGEVLANVYVVPDEVALQTKVTRTERIEQRKADLQEKSSKEKDRLVKKQLRRELAHLQKEEDKLREEIAQMRSDYAITKLLAPVDGVVIAMPDYTEEKQLVEEEALFQIAKADYCYVTVKDEGNLLNYGMEVAVTYTDLEGKEQKTTGTVVTYHGTSLSTELQSDDVLIELPAEDIGNMELSARTSGGLWNKSRLTVSCTARQIENVLLIPKKAVTRMKGQTYVKVRTENGGAAYVGFVPCGSDQINYGVAEGLTEGMEICFE